MPDAPTIVTSPRGLRARGWLPSLSFPDRAAAGRLLAFAKRHWVFLLLAAVGIALRVVTAMAYSPSLPLRNKDAYQYIARAETFSPVGSFHPFLYSATLKPFLAADADAQPRFLAVLIDYVAEYGDAHGQRADDEIDEVVAVHCRPRSPPSI